MMASVAGRYAAALFDLAQENNQQADVESDLGKFQALLDMSDDLSRLVRNALKQRDLTRTEPSDLSRRGG